MSEDNRKHLNERVCSDKNNPQIIGTFAKNKNWKSLGRGGFGEVFGIQDWVDSNGKTHSIALKKSQHTPGAEHVLQKEIASLSKLSHLFVVKYLGLAEMEHDDKNSIVIAMELCEGDLKTYILEGLPNIPKGSLNSRVILGHVVLGLTYIHDLGIIHKDLKPDNILLWKSPSGLVLAKLADFGFSKCLREDETEHSDTTHFGSWGYMAPELLMAASSEPKQPAKCSYATDAYALGIVISFTANGGKHPFGQNRIYRDYFMSVGTAPTELDADWDLTDLVARLTYKDPKKRPRVDIVIYHPFFVLSNNADKNHFQRKVYLFSESFTDLIYTYDGIVDSSSNDSDIKLDWFQKNFCHHFTTLKLDTNSRKQGDGQNASSTDQKASTSNYSEQIETAGSNSSSFDQKIKERLSTNPEKNILKTIKLSGDYTRYHSYRVNSNAPELFNFYFWCMLYYLRPQVFPVLAGTNDHFKKCFKMTELEFATLHYTDEFIKEIWDLKYETETHGKGAQGDEDAQPLFIYTSCHLFPSFLSENLVNRFNSLINSTENGYKGRPLLNWVTFNEPSFDGKSESPEHFIRILLEKGADVNGTDIFGLTPVHMAAINIGRYACAILKVLLEEGRGDSNFPNERLKDPVQEAIISLIPLDMIKDSLAEKIKTGLALIQQQDKNVTTAESNSNPVDVESSEDRLIASFLDSEGNLLPQFRMLLQNLKIPLLLHPRVLEGIAFILLGLLTKSSGSPFVHVLEGRTPVHCAASNESTNGPELLKLLLNHKGDPNLRDRDGWTALHCAAANKGGFGLELVKILLQRGGDATIVNKDGKTALDLAKSCSTEYGSQIAALLEEHLGTLEAISRPPNEKKMKLDSEDRPSN